MQRYRRPVQTPQPRTIVLLRPASSSSKRFSFPFENPLALHQDVGNEYLGLEEATVMEVVDAVMAVAMVEGDKALVEDTEGDVVEGDKDGEEPP